MDSSERTALVEELIRGIEVCFGSLVEVKYDEASERIKQTRRNLVGIEVMPIIERLLAERDLSTMLDEALSPFSSCEIGYADERGETWLANLWDRNDCMIEYDGSGPTPSAALQDAIAAASAREVGDAS